MLSHVLIKQYIGNSMDCLSQLQGGGWPQLQLSSVEEIILANILDDDDPWVNMFGDYISQLLGDYISIY